MLDIQSIKVIQLDNENIETYEYGIKSDRDVGFTLEEVANMLTRYGLNVSDIHEFTKTMPKRTYWITRDIKDFEQVDGDYISCRVILDCARLQKPKQDETELE